MRFSLVVLVLLNSLLLAEDIESDFLQSLDEVSEIATKTKLNIDDTPSFVTVLQSQKLKKLGIKNVFEALALVPGVELTKELSGVPVIVFRGVTQKSEVKLMIDGVTINNTYRGSIYYYLDFPVELIDRIEVIRGAGSILYGSNAISGVINIITKNTQDVTKELAFISSGTYNTKRIGALVSTKIAGVKVALDAYDQRDTKTLTTYSALQSGPNDQHLRDYSIGVNISGEKLSFNARMKKSNGGNAYGLFTVLDSDSNRFDNDNRSLFYELTYKDDIDKKNSVKVTAGYTNYRQKLEVAHYLGFVITTDYEERNYFSELNLISKSIENNRILAGIRGEWIHELKNGWYINGVARPNPLVRNDFSRRVWSFYLNDEYSFNSRLDLSAGMRYDYYSDFKGSFSPNFGAVYKLRDDLRWKLLYSHSFRAPSLIELTSNSALRAEKSNTVETGLVYKYSSKHTARVNIYATKIYDMITKDSTTNKYVQQTKNSFYGVELDYSYLPTNSVEIDLLASYIDARDNGHHPIANVANVLASATLLYELDSGFVFGSYLRYVSGTKRFVTDMRPKSADSWIFNQTLSYNYKDLTASLVVHDLFNSKTYYTTVPNRYNQDFNDGGRTIMLNVSLEF